MTALLQEIRILEEALDAELAKRRVEFNYAIHSGKVHFEQVMIARHRAVKMRLSRYLLESRPLMLLTAPLIYSLVVPFALLDLCVTVYQAVCFRVYRIPRVCRQEYFCFDRGHLAYLNVIEKLNCLYCSYANGLIGYVREVASRTEQYWCPIKHARRVIATHERYSRFIDYGDAEAYRRDFPAMRQQVQKAPNDPGGRSSGT
ncbi:MAG TPA: hypothetical protein VGV09_14290 [Steroidobacteraceae bacterium]|nr:hypothetical protein [Steroidobacteraceae bacterium]